MLAGFAAPGEMSILDDNMWTRRWNPGRFVSFGALVFAPFLGAAAPATPTVLRALASGTDGAAPSGLIQASDGLLYGTTAFGGAANAGTIFRTNPDGSGFTVLRTMTAGRFGQPRALLQASDGRLYGAAGDLSTNGQSVIFTMALDGSGFAVVK